jgi:hypothetical protein
VAETRLSGALIRTGTNIGPVNKLSVGDVTTPSGSLHVGGTTVLQQILEKNTIAATAATGTINFNVLSQGVLYYTTNSSGNWTLNFTGDISTTLNDIMYIGQSLSLAFLVTNGSPAFYVTSHTIDGASVTPKWQGGAVPSAGNTNCIDVYSYVIIKTANATFTVLASVIPFV